MTKLLERAVAEAAALPEDQQDALASRLLAEMEDERQWASSFDATSDGQWDALAAMARRGRKTGGSVALKDVVSDG
jgi:hypothetical protein